MTGRELIRLILSNVSNIDKPVVIGGQEVTGVEELVYGPEDMLIAGQDLKGQINLLTKGGNV